MTAQNLHTHTTFCDGKNTPAEMVRGAISAGCTSLGFSGHSPLPWGPDGWATPAEDLMAYRQEVLRLQTKYRGVFPIFLGLEQDVDSLPPRESWDYLIGSVHSIHADGHCLSVDHTAERFTRAVDWHFGGDYQAFAEAYFQRVTAVADLPGCQIVGHLDLVTKFNEGGRLFDETHPRYVTAAMEAIDILLKRDMIFEINTGAMSRGYRSVPYPAPLLLRAIRERGGRICITSDSHSAETVLYGFRDGAELARECGFRETWLLSEKGFVPQKL